jgi:glycosyltransferase involved in cell wall biosynthesis
VNLVQLLAEQLHISVLTGCRDIGDNQDLPGIISGEWNSWKNKTDVWYATRQQHWQGAFVRACREKNAETVYLNSMFSVTGTIIPLLSSPFLKSTRIVLAPRGMLKPTALAFRQGRKKAWLRFLKASGIAKRIHFHATSDEEREEIQEHFGKNTAITVIPNVPRIPASNLRTIEKKRQSLRLSFVGRVHPIKNLHLVLELLKRLQGSCHLDVVGPVEDEKYSDQCQRLIEELPAEIQVVRHGALSADKTIETIANSHAMILPTQGENFGHAIFEAMGSGVPVVISDQTYWRHLEKDHAGWDIPLGQQDRFHHVLSQLMEMDQAMHNQWRVGAHQRALRFFDENRLLDSYLELLGGC